MAELVALLSTPKRAARRGRRRADRRSLTRPRRGSEARSATRRIALDERVVQLVGDVVAHARHQQQLGAGDRRRRGAAAGDVHHLVGRAVDDQRGHRQARAAGRMRSGWVTTATICAGHARGADPAVPGLPGALARRPPGVGVGRASR